MKKMIMVLCMVFVLIVSVGIVFAGKKVQTQTAFNGLHHEGQANQLYLYEKYSSDWSIVEDGAWGKMTYTEEKFVFNGHGLESGIDYTLTVSPKVIDF